MTNSTTTTITFVPSLTEVNKDTDIIAADVVSMGTEGIIYFTNEAIDNGTTGEVFVVDGNMELATNMAAVLNAQYQEEMKLMKDAQQTQQIKQEVEKAAAPVNKIKRPAKAKATAKPAAKAEDKAALRSNADAKKFLKEAASKLANAKQSPKKNKSEGEETMTTTTTTTEETKPAKSIRRRTSTAKATTQTKGETTMTTTNTPVQEKGAAIKEKHEAKKAKAPAGRRSSSKKEVASQVAEQGGAGKMGRDKPQTESTFVKFEGPWYLNASRYDVLNRLSDIVMDKADAELGITDITVSNKEEFYLYKNRQDILFVIQFKANGNILTFPIKAAGERSNSDVSSPSIGWVEYQGKLYPRFGFSRRNVMEVEFTCGCGAKNKANPGNMYCKGCKKLWADMEVTIGEYGYEVTKEDWVFQEIPNLKVPTETLVLALAIAQFDEGLDMWDLPGFEEDAE